jgi:hypothetical protein
MAVTSPRLGSLSLSPTGAQLWANHDRKALSPLFSEVRESRTTPPTCDVLLIYGEIDEKGRFQNAKSGLREIIRDSGAKIVVVASENPAKHCIAAGKRTGYGLANLVMTLDRKGDALPAFLVRLFTIMQRGVPMPKAWSTLAPQSKGTPHAGLPDTIFACELGDILFAAAPRAISAPPPPRRSPRRP